MLNSACGYTNRARKWAPSHADGRTPARDALSNTYKIHHRCIVLLSEKVKTVRLYYSAFSIISQGWLVNAPIWCR
jgi:hypothetical protein